MVDKPNEPSEVWEHPFAEVVDRKLKPIKHDLQQLKKAHNAVAQRHQEILEISSRYIARFIILSIACLTRDIIYREKPNIDERFIAQLAADAKGARTEVDKSDNPLRLSAKFEDKCSELLESLEIKAVII